MERYGVFKRLPKGGFMRVCPTEDLTEATTKMLDLASKSDDEHFVHDFVLRRTVATSLEGIEAVGSPAA
jgi:hypothetical protein